MFFCVRPGISLSAKGCPKPKGPRKEVFCDFPPLGFRSAKTQNVKKLRNFGENLFGRNFFPKVPLAPQNCVFLFPARNFSQCQGAALGQKGLKNQYFAISRPWGSSRRKHDVKKLRNFWEKPLGRTDFFRESAPSSGKSRFSVFGPEFF